MRCNRMRNVPYCQRSFMRDLEKELRRQGDKVYEVFLIEEFERVQIQYVLHCESTVYLEYLPHPIENIRFMGL